MMLSSTISFEIHLTTNELTESHQINFINFCLENEAKPLFIELSKGVFTQQPMLSKIVYADSFETVLDISNRLSTQLIDKGFLVKRLKIEIPSLHAHLLKQDASKSEKYFEWHGKITYTAVEKLLEICEKHKVHLSRNSLKNEADKRFITLREHGSQTVFENRINALTSDLKRGNWEISKQQSEYCIYDNNEFLDKGWLSE